ncbi:hypothetical protein CJ209_08995 [Fusobacterium nucleatum]|uniref:Riboflavin synthase subunit alpha n=1 Tax=Fusobacterium nucleatum TaxID=851 RepID=A0A2N6TH00_FUSNU|nr:hypothetical protein CJ209_08995 [Fusobacterium nucleatum]
MNEASLVNLQRILDFLSLRNLASNELFFISFVSLQQPHFFTSFPSLNVVWLIKIIINVNSNYQLLDHF